MNNHVPPRSKSHTTSPDGQHPATPALTTHGSWAPKVVGRQAVRSALLPDPHPHTGPVPLAWLHVRAPGRGTGPTATSVCACGRDHHAVGDKRVAALITDHTDHREACPLRTSAEGRAAA